MIYNQILFTLPINKFLFTWGESRNIVFLSSIDIS